MISWSRTTLLELLGLFNSSDGTMPLYFRTTPGANVPAGTYTDVLTITWVYRFCYVGLDLLGIRCIRITEP
ncbi:MAG: spore coat protein U domain-containing protein [Enterobacteriaceae bacterium]